MKNKTYNLIVAPDFYPGKKYRGRYIAEHIYVWWQNTGQIPPTGIVVHHKNGNHKANRFENLELMTKSDHAKFHTKDKPTKTVDLVCGYCGEIFTRKYRQVVTKIKNGQINFYCCRNHQVKEQWNRGTIFAGKYHNR